MSDYVTTVSGVMVPEPVARSVLYDAMYGVRGAYRTANPNNKNTAGWKTSFGSADTDTLGDLIELRKQSRDLIRNESIASGAINQLETSVVHTGIVPQSIVNRNVLGITEEEAEAFQTAAEAVFNHWAASTSAHVARRLNFWQMQSILYRSSMENGDAVAIRRMKSRPGQILETCIQLVEADRCCTPAALTGTANVRAGVRTDEDGEPLSYYFMQGHPGDPLYLENEYTEVPAFDLNGDPLVLMIMWMNRLGQTRGVPILAPVIEPLKQLGRFTEAELAATVISSMFAVFVKSPAAGTAASPINSFGALPGQVGLVGPGAGMNGSLSQSKQTVKLQSGMVMDLAPGEEIQVAEAQRPNTAFDGFVTSIFNQIGMHLGVPREVLTRAYTASYSAARAAIMDAYQTFTKHRDMLVMQFCQPTWCWVISEAVARGYLVAPGFFDDPLRRAAWLGTTWRGSSAPQIDPLKEARAAEVWNKLNVKSLTTIATEQNMDWEAENRRIVKERSLVAPPMLTDAAPVMTDENRADDDSDLEDETTNRNVDPDESQQALDLIWKYLQS